jgi:hypothetical protein
MKKTDLATAMANANALEDAAETVAAKTRAVVAEARALAEECDELRKALRSLIDSHNKLCALRGANGCDDCPNLHANGTAWCVVLDIDVDL